jgi:hypothetical protein
MVCGQSLTHNLPTHVFSHNGLIIVKHVVHPTCEMPHPCYLLPIRAICGFCDPNIQRGCYHITKLVHVHRCNQKIKGKEFVATQEALLYKSYFIISPYMITLIKRKIMLGEGSSRLEPEVATFNWGEDG